MNLKKRLKNPYFIAGVIMSILTPLVLYMNMSLEDITSWSTLYNLLVSAIMNPYLLATILVNVFNTLVDYTTPGLNDTKGGK